MFFNQIYDNLYDFINNYKNTAIYLNISYVYLIVCFDLVLKLV